VAQAKRKTVAKTSAGKTGARKSTAGKKQTGRKTSSSRTNNKRKTAGKQDEGGILQEISILLSFALAVILFLGVLDVAGEFGSVLHDVEFGLFGSLAYLFPPLLFWAVCFLISNSGHEYRLAASVKVLIALLTFAACCGIVELLGGRGLEMSYSRQEYYKYGADGLNGGWVGGVLFDFLYPLLGMLGSYVVLVIIAIIGVVTTTGKSFIKPLHKGGSRVVITAKEDLTRFRENQAIRSAKRREERLRVEQKVQGVALDNTKLPESEAEAEETPEAPVRERKPQVDASQFTGQIHLPLSGEPAAAPAEMPPAGRERVAVQKDQRTLAELEALDAELKAGMEMPGEEDFFSFERPGSPLATAAEPVIPGWEGMPEDAEDPMAAYDAFRDAPSPEAVLRETVAAVSVPVPVPAPVKKKYVMPPLRLLKSGRRRAGMRDAELKATAVKLQQTLQNFGVGVTVTDISCGPSVTRYELQPEQGVKVSRIVALSDDIKLNLAAADIRIEAPIPGKAAIGIEVPNQENQTVFLKELLDSEEFKKFPSKVGFGVGRDIAGKVIVADLARMPHLLIAGATGSGKSVCINTLIMSILYKAHPDDVKLIMIDPKVVELSVYNGIPHLLIPVVTDPKKAAGALNWAVAEMTDRYKKFAELNVRDIKGYNHKVEEADEEEELEKMPQIVVIVDELADLMMVAPGEVEEAICRLAQLARAAGIHLVLATQRPSVNVITGLIKANVPSRIAFAVSSGVDSRTIIDMVGAEKLLGKGDMLFYPSGYPKPVRVQGAFVSDEEVGAIVEFLTKQTDGAPVHHKDLEMKMEGSFKDEGSVGAGQRDEYFERCGRFIIEKEKASIGNLQRAFKIGFNRAARIMDQLSEAGVVGPEEGTKPRQVLMTMAEFEEMTAGW